MKKKTNGKRSDREKKLPGGKSCREEKVTGRKKYREKKVTGRRSYREQKLLGGKKSLGDISYDSGASQKRATVASHTRSVLFGF